MSVAVMVALGSLMFCLPLALWRIGGCRHLRYLPTDDLPDPSGSWPRVSVIAPARNEARKIGEALDTWRRLQYPSFEVIVVDDRSTDATAAILARQAIHWPNLKVLTVTTLPAGWLGKNHANHLAAAAADGDWILFTDADVLLAPEVLNRAIGYAEEQHLDHLVVGPRATMPGFFLRQFPLYFGLLFVTITRPWALRNPRSTAHIGIGAFNLVRASAYKAIGGHERLKMRPDDDLKLGKALKFSGHTQDFLIGGGAVSVEWYSNWRQLQTGLMKNLYAGVDYKAGLVLAGVAANLLFLVWPPVALLFLQGTGWWLNAGLCLIAFLEGLFFARQFGTAPWAGLLLGPFGLVGAWLMLRALVLTHWQGGIRWRGTFYPLNELRANHMD